MANDRYGGRRAGRDSLPPLREANRERESRRMRNKNRLDEADVPSLPDHVTAEDLPTWMLAQLRGLGEKNGELVARHLAMVLETLEEAPELAYRHARAAADRAGRIALIREYAGVTSYYTQRWAEAVRELRAYQRISGEKHHTALLADALRGIGKAREALELAAATPTADLDRDETFELGIVIAGTRADLGEYASARAGLERLGRNQLTASERARLDEAKERLAALEGGATPESQDFADGSDGSGRRGAPDVARRPADVAGRAATAAAPPGG
ncbi:MAG: hypothetical protein LBO20_06215, partial [Bifidobacteriaceae bacterium]|nr:hypothetical protein [Bifidobacteriaceae bacterium]